MSRYDRKRARDRSRGPPARRDRPLDDDVIPDPPSPARHRPPRTDRAAPAPKLNPSDSPFPYPDRLSSEARGAVKALVQRGFASLLNTIRKVHRATQAYDRVKDGTPIPASVPGVRITAPSFAKGCAISTGSLQAIDLLFQEFKVGVLRTMQPDLFRAAGNTLASATAEQESAANDLARDICTALNRLAISASVPVSALFCPPLSADADLPAHVEAYVRLLVDRASATSLAERVRDAARSTANAVEKEQRKRKAELARTLADDLTVDQAISNLTEVLDRAVDKSIRSRTKAGIPTPAVPRRSPGPRTSHTRSASIRSRGSSASRSGLSLRSGSTRSRASVPSSGRSTSRDTVRRRAPSPAFPGPPRPPRNTRSGRRGSRSSVSSRPSNGTPYPRTRRRREHQQQRRDAAVSFHRGDRNSGTGSRRRPDRRGQSPLSTAVRSVFTAVTRATTRHAAPITDGDANTL